MKAALPRFSFYPLSVLAGALAFWRLFSLFLDDLLGAILLVPFFIEIYFKFLPFLKTVPHATLLVVSPCAAALLLSSIFSDLAGVLVLFSLCFLTMIILSSRVRSDQFIASPSLVCPRNCFFLAPLYSFSEYCPFCQDRQQRFPLPSVCPSARIFGIHIIPLSFCKLSPPFHGSWCSTLAP